MVADRRTALKRARELFTRGDRRGASKALMEAGFSGAQVEAVFEGFLLEPSGGARPPPKPSQARPPPPPSPREKTKGPGTLQPRPGEVFIAFFRKSPWRPVAAAAGAAALVAALLLLRPPSPVGGGVEPTLPPSTGPLPSSPSSGILDLGLPGVASAVLGDCRWSDWTGDGAQDGVEASVQFRDPSGRGVSVGLPQGSFKVTAALTETVRRFKFDNVTGPRFETESRVMPVAGAEAVPEPGVWRLRVAADPKARATLNFSDSATYLLAEELKTSVSPRFPGSCSF